MHCRLLLIVLTTACFQVALNPEMKWVLESNGQLFGIDSNSIATILPKLDNKGVALPRQFSFCPKVLHVGTDLAIADQQDLYIYKAKKWRHVLLPIRAYKAFTCGNRSFIEGGSVSDPSKRRALVEVTDGKWKHIAFEERFTSPCDGKSPGIKIDSKTVLYWHANKLVTRQVLPDQQILALANNLMVIGSKNSGRGSLINLKSNKRIDIVTGRDDRYLASRNFIWHESVNSGKYSIRRWSDSLRSAEFRLPGLKLSNVSSCSDRALVTSHLDYGKTESTNTLRVITFSGKTLVLTEKANLGDLVLWANTVAASEHIIAVIQKGGLRLFTPD